MEEYFYIIDWLVIILGSLSLVFVLGLFTFLCFQRFMWWKHKDFMTYRYMKKLSKKDSEEFWEYVTSLKEKNGKVIEDELLEIKNALEYLEDNKSDEISRWFNNKNFEFRNVLEEEYLKIKERKENK